MSVTITGRILNSQVDKRASLGNDQIIRFPEPLGTWTKIRLGIRLSLNTTADVTGTPRLYFGMCNGVEEHVSGAGSMTTRNFLGVVTTDATWTYGLTPVEGYPYVTIDSVAAVHRVTTTNTLSAGTALATLAAYPQLYRNCFYVTIDKTTPAATTVEFISPNNAGNSVEDVALADFFTQLKSETTVILPNYLRTVYATTFNINEATNGTLNAVNLSWNKFSNRIEVSDFAYHVFV